MLYRSGLKGPFFLDDYQFIAYSRTIEISPAELVAVLRDITGDPLGRPLTNFSFSLVNHLFGFEPFFHKSVNFFVHVMVGLVLFLFSRNLLRLLNADTGWLSTLTAFLAILLWWIHPIQVSTVLYAAQRSAQLSALFIAVSLLSYGFGRVELLAGRRRGYLFVAAAYSCFCPLAVLCKESGALCPLYLLAVEYFLLGFRTRGERDRGLKLIHLAATVAFVLGGALYASLKWRGFSYIFFERGYTSFQRLLTEFQVLVFYLELIFLPRPSSFGIYHDGFQLVRSLDLITAVCFFLLVSLLTVAFVFRKRAPVAAFSVFWFTFAHLMESTFLPLEFAFEHRNYLALFGPALGMGYLAVNLVHNGIGFRRLASIVAAVVVVVSLGTMTALRSRWWSSDEQFVMEAARNHPLSPRTHLVLSIWYEGFGSLERALRELQIAEYLRPRDASIPIRKLTLFCSSPALPDDIFLQAARAAATRPVCSYAVTELDTLTQKLLKGRCPSVKAWQLRTLLDSATCNRWAQYHPFCLSSLYRLRAGALWAENDARQAITSLEKAHRWQPQSLEPLYEKALVETKLGMYDRARKTLRTLRQGPGLRSPEGARRVRQLEELLEKSR